MSTERYARIYELEKQGKSSWYAEHYVDMMSKIHGWERIYSNWRAFERPDVPIHVVRGAITAVRFLVLEEKRTTRSPSKIDAINKWLQDNPE